MRGIKSGSSLVLCIGLLIGSSSGVTAQSEEPDAAVVEPPPAPTRFSATYSSAGRSNPGSTTEHDDGTMMTVGMGWMWNSRESSDPRFAGPLVLTLTGIEAPGGDMSVNAYRIETAEGAWQQVPTAGVGFEEDNAKWESGLLPPAGNIQFWTFIGEGDYEGLTAVVQETWRPGGADGLVQFDGFIFEGDLWDAPEPWVP